jgi:hypothetical protein
MRTLNVERFSVPKSDFAPGPAPMQDWIETDKLVVDDSYQREIGRRGAHNVAQIAEAFDWSKFAPVIVAPVEGGKFAIVDGQHRTTAAMLRGLTSVPCHIVQADRAQQAAAFAAVNGNITKTTSSQLFFARLSAGDGQCQAVSRACLDAGITILRSNKSHLQMKQGQTTAAACMARCLGLYGEVALVAALRAINRTADGNAGFLRPTIIEAMCAVLHEHPNWRDSGDLLLTHMNKFSFPDAWEKITAGRDQIFPSTAKAEMIAMLTRHLTRKFGDAMKRAA